MTKFNLKYLKFIHKKTFYIIWERVLECIDEVDSVFSRSVYRIEQFHGLRGIFLRPYIKLLNFDTNPKTKLLIMILLSMCGDTGALLNPGPINKSKEDIHIEKIWEKESNNCKIKEKEDIKLYKKFEDWIKNKIYTEREREKMKENFIENEIDWRHEIKCVTGKTYTRIKNCRKNNILENWKKIEMEKYKKLQNNKEKMIPNKEKMNG